MKKPTDEQLYRIAQAALSLWDNTWPNGYSLNRATFYRVARQILMAREPRGVVSKPGDVGHTGTVNTLFGTRLFLDAAPRDKSEPPFAPDYSEDDCDY